MIIRRFRLDDLTQAIGLWNEIVRESVAFPQIEQLDKKTGKDFFLSQSYTGVAENDGEIVGIYIVHPNNVGRCGHICNASYGVIRKKRGLHIGEKLVKDSLVKAKECGFRILQFNAVVATNTHAIHLYERLGFKPLGTIEDGFLMKDGTYEDICPFYIAL